MNKFIAISGLLGGLLGGCAAIPEQGVLQSTLQSHLPGASAPPALSTTSISAPSLPAGSVPWSQDTAMRVALAHSPALQSLIASSRALQAQTLAQGRPGLLSLSLERTQQGDDISLARHLSIGLLELLTWPLSAASAQRQIDQQQLELTRQVMGHLHDTRMQWARAVAAQQREQYLLDVLSVAKTASELARRMQEAGQFSASQGTEPQIQEAQARTALAQAHLQTSMEREALIRLLGISEPQAQAMVLPDRLPDIPSTLPADPANTPERSDERLNKRLDVRLAQARWQATQSSSTAMAASSVVDIELGAGRSTHRDAPVEHSRDLSVKLQALDLGTAQRAAGSASQDAARWSLQATLLQAQSELRSSEAQRQAAYDVAQTARQTLVPLHQRLVDERLKQYNGMLIGPLELLAQARQYRDSVITALDAQRDYWLADAQWQAASEGSATGLLSLNASPASDTSAPSPASGH
jgi:outer membrane protein TolC